MPGRMGMENVKVENQRVYKIDAERSLIYVIGSVPGKEGTVIRIKDAPKK